MSGSEKKGPLPAYQTVPPTPNSPHYPVQQGPPMPPRGAPPAYTPAPPPGHQQYPQQPYYPASAVPQAYQGYGQPAHNLPPYGQQSSYPAAPAPGAPVSGAYAPMYMAPPAGGAMVIPGAFDAGARFDRGSQPTIPPPPPGCPPNAAQLAAMQGQQVIATQRKGNFWVDGSGGGTSFW